MLKYNNLKQKIIESGHTLRYAAQYSGISEQGLHKGLKNGTLSMEVMLKLSDLLACSVYDLIITDEEPHQVNDHEAAYNQQAEIQRLKTMLKQQERMINTLLTQLENIKK